ncbi:MAG: hypothetical protein KIH69_008895 [Anaerolineae bacterium]|nr:hypothetical protein [Anaerolineae bacterium]
MACTAAPTATPVATPSRPPVLGTIDGVGGDLRYGGNMVVVGWAADMVRGTPVNGVEVVIDGRWTLPATIGDDRPDVVKLLGMPGVAKSGWSIQFSLGTLPPGRHNLGVLVYDSQNRPILLALVYPFDILPAAGQEAPLPVAAATRPAPAAAGAQAAVTATTAATAAITTSNVITGNFEGIEGTARPGWVVISRGWAADTKAVGPATQVNLLLDGKVMMTSTLGVERPDIAKELGKPEYLKSGWVFRMSLPESLAVGKHKLKAIAQDAQGRSAQLGSEIEFEMLPAVVQPRPQAPAVKEASPVVKDAPKEATKEAPKDAPKDAPKEQPKEQPTPKP